MPATSLIVMESGRHWASRARGALSGLPVRLHETRDVVRFQAALEESLDAVVIVELALSDDILRQVLRRARQRRAAVIAAGDAPAWSVDLELREWDVLAVMSYGRTESAWRSLLSRAIGESQSRLAIAEGRRIPSLASTLGDGTRISIPRSWRVRN